METLNANTTFRHVQYSSSYNSDRLEDKREKTALALQTGEASDLVTDNTTEERYCDKL